MKTSEKATKRAEQCGILILESYRINSTTKHKYICNNCGTEKETSDATLLRWSRNGTKFCPACRGTGKGLTPREKQDQFNSLLSGIYKEKIIMQEYLGCINTSKRSSCVIKFLDCGHTKEYQTDTAKQMMKLGKAFKCDECGSSTSAQESWSGDLLPYDQQVPYSSLFDCEGRRWIADYVVDNLIIEVTTESKLSKLDYLQNIQEKTLAAAKNNYSLIVVTSLSNIQDIVRTLSKGKE